MTISGVYNANTGRWNIALPSKIIAATITVTSKGVDAPDLSSGWKDNGILHNTITRSTFTGGDETTGFTATYTVPIVNNGVNMDAFIKDAANGAICSSVVCVATVPAN